jgi:hypothetical protein
VFQIAPTVESHNVLEQKKQNKSHIIYNKINGLVYMYLYIVIYCFYCFTVYVSASLLLILYVKKLLIEIAAIAIWEICIGERKPTANP